MNKYDEYTKADFRKLFNEHMPKFPFPVTIKPLTFLTVANWRRVFDICKSIGNDFFIWPDETLIRSLAQDREHEELCPFEKEIFNSEGFSSLLFLMDIHYNLFEDNIKLHTCEYLRRERVINFNNADSFGEIVFLPHITTRVELNHTFGDKYGAYTRAVDFIRNIHQHKIVVMKQHDNHLTIPLPKLMTYDFKDYDVRKEFYPEINTKITLSDDFKDAEMMIQMVGLENVILPPYIYEADSIN